VMKRKGVFPGLDYAIVIDGRILVDCRSRHGCRDRVNRRDFGFEITKTVVHTR
jgi:hypothetical protein